jgi:predicted CopG family antitoxin
VKVRLSGDIQVGGEKMCDIQVVTFKARKRSRWRVVMQKQGVSKEEEIEERERGSRRYTFQMYVVRRETNKK